MRIISGTYKGRRLDAPPGDATRPTSDRAREALFSMLQSRLGDLDGLEVVDLFAGTGALGLEALSRGAAFATFVEKERSTVDGLKQNINRLGAGERCDVRSQSVESLGSPRRPCDLLFMDPPYGAGLVPKTVERLVERAWIAPGAWLSIECARDEDLQLGGFVLDVRRIHGKAALHLFRAAI